MTPDPTNELQAWLGADAEGARLVRAPYRICPLGAHIDHQLGPVTAMALDQAVQLAFVPAPTREIRLRSLAFEGEVRFELGNEGEAVPGDWGNYARGAATALARSYHLSRGITGVITGDLHAGGLSSSAAAGLAYLLALEKANDLHLGPPENIELDRLIENEYLGLRNGLLDQAAILLSRKRHLLHFDCNSGAHQLLAPAESMPGFAIVVAFSGIQQPLTATGYNLRVAECAQAAALLLDHAGRCENQPRLGHVTPDEYADGKHLLSGPLARRAAHFFGERERVCRGVKAWLPGDLRAFGALMTESGRSSIENYECGCAPLIDLYETLISLPGVCGARFSGAGFRGCCVALVEEEAAPDVASRVQAAYAKRHPLLATLAPVHICHSADGATVL